MSHDRSAHFALDGYKYQFDKAILAFATAPNPNTAVTLEGIEDIDLPDELVQCKYHASRKYAPSAIRKPIVEFLKHFARVHPTTITYRLFAHFGQCDRPLGAALTVDEVLTVLGTTPGPHGVTIDGTNSIAMATFNEFVSTHLIFETGCDIKALEEEAKSALRTMLLCDAVECDSLFYNNALAFVFQLSREPEVSKRTATPDAFRAQINCRTTLLTHWLARFRSTTEHLRFVRDHLSAHSAMRPSKWRYVIFDSSLIAAIGPNAIAHFVEDATQKHFAPGRALHDAKPLSFVFDCPAATLNLIKIHLLDRNVPFNDGHEPVRFDTKAFDRPPVINLRPTAKGKASDTIEVASYHVRLLSLTAYCDGLDSLTPPHTVIVLSPNATLLPRSHAQSFQYVVPDVCTITEVAKFLIPE